MKLFIKCSKWYVSLQIKIIRKKLFYKFNYIILILSKYINKKLY